MSPGQLIAQGDADAPEQFSRSWWGDMLLDLPLKIAGLILVGLVVRYLVHRLTDRVVARMANTVPPARVLGSKQAARIISASSGVYSERRALRARTLGSLLKSIVTATIGTVVVVMILDILGYPIGPLLASAGIAGVALGFGAQNLVKDFLAGLAMLLEDQYGVGDVIDMGQATGTVEAVGIRVTRLRGVDGTVWYVRNGEVIRVGNTSQDWARAIVDVRISYGEDVQRALSVLTDAAGQVADDPEWEPKLLESPEVSGVESLATDAVVLRVMVKTQAADKIVVERELRERITRAFEAEDLQVPNRVSPPPATPPA